MLNAEYCVTVDHNKKMCWICFEYWIKLSSILSHHSNLPSFFNLINDLQTNWKYSRIKTERQLTWESQSTVYRVSKKNQNLTRFEEKKSNGNWQTNLHQSKLSFAKVDCIWIFFNQITIAMYQYWWTCGQIIDLNEVECMD